MLKPDFGSFSGSFGLIRCRTEQAAQAFLAWQRPVLARYGLSYSEPVAQTGPLDDALRGLLPLTSPGMLRVLFWPVDGEWTIYFDNSGLETQSATVMPVLSERLGVDALRVVMHDAARDPSTGRITRYAATIFEAWRSGTHQRAIYAANDGGRWKFGASGTAFPFEEAQRYSAPRVRERFTHDMLLACLQALGISLDGVAQAVALYGPGQAMHKLGELPVAPRVHG